MSIKDIITKQYRDIVNGVARQVHDVTSPREGWLCTARKSLQMSGAQLGRRLGVTRAQISKTEKNELSGSVTIKTMQQMAEAMECRFVYAIVPEKTIEEIIEKRAEMKAKEIVEQTDKHMALEDQTLSPEQREFEIKRLTKEIMDKLPANFWEDKR